MDLISKGLDLADKHGPLLVLCAIMLFGCVYLLRKLLLMAEARIADHKESQPILLQIKASLDMNAEAIRNLTAEVRSRQ